MTKSRLARFVLLGALILFFGSGCSKSSSTTGPTNPSGSHLFTSTTVSGHSHTGALSKTEVQTPPAAGVSRSTSSSAGHSHTFSLSQAQLTTILNGGSVTVSTSVVSGHSHEFTFTKWF